MKNPTYYETMYILRPDIPEDEVNTHIKKYSEILEKAKAEIIDNQLRGKRRLAYSIGKHKENGRDHKKAQIRINAFLRIMKSLGKTNKISCTTLVKQITS